MLGAKGILLTKISKHSAKTHSTSSLSSILYYLELEKELMFTL